MAEYEVTGVRWQMGEGLTMEQRTQMAEEFLRTLKVGTPMILAAEPDNPHDNEAIAVYMDYTRRVGYIKHECCAEVKGLLDGDGQCDAVVSGNDGHVTSHFTCTPTATSPASASSCSSSASCPRSSTTSCRPTARTSATSTSNAKPTTPFLHKFSIPFPHKFH